MFKNIGAFEIDINGVKSVLLHCLMIGVAATVMAIVSAVQSWITNTPDAFGANQALVVFIIGTFAAYLKKWAFPYIAPIDNSGI